MNSDFIPKHGPNRSGTGKLVVASLPFETRLELATKLAIHAVKSIVDPPTYAQPKPYIRKIRFSQIVFRTPILTNRFQLSES